MSFDPTARLAEGVTLLEASAGTGKTWSIASLALELVAQGVPIGELLIVTFTEAATAELRERVRARLRDGLAVLGGAPSGGDPVLAHVATIPDATARVRLALESFDEAQIHTIHGFCKRVLQANAFESGADLDLELETDATPLLQQLVADWLTRELHDAPLAMVQALRSQGVTQASLIQLAAEVAARPRLVVVPEKPGAPPEVNVTGWQRAHDCARSLWIEGRQAIEALLTDAITRKALSGQKWRPDWLRTRLAAMDGWAAAPGDPFRALPDAMPRFLPDALATATSKGGTAPHHPAFDALDELVAHTEALAEVAAAVALSFRHGLVAWVRQELPRRKAALRLQTFDDLIHAVEEAVTGPAGGRLVASIRSRTRAALIDEFQDTDPAQWRIFHTLFASPPCRLVLIGDPKQAIYGFRGADIYAYLGARDTARATFALDRNHRSDAGLIGAVQHLFGRPAIHAPFVEERIPWTPVAPRHMQRLQAPDGWAPLTVRFLPRPAKPWGKAALCEALATLVAADVARLLSSGASIEGRPLTARDVAVLVRSHHQAAQVQRALRDVGVPAVRRGGADVLGQEEATDLLRVMDAALEPGRLGVLKAALATDLVGLGASELAALEDDPEALERWIVLLRDLGRLWRQEGVMRMVRALLDAVDYAPRVLAQVGGERRMVNLLHAAELLHGAAEERRLEPAGLVAWLRAERLEESKSEERALRLESDADAAQVVTLHGSKGLQYPVVYCPHLWDGKTSKGAELLRFHPGGGTDVHLHVDPTAPDRQGAADAVEREDRAEAMRLAYVGLTRAEHRAVIYWAAATDAEGSPLARLLHPSEEPLSWKQTDDEALIAELECLADGSGGSVGVLVTAPGEEGARWEAPQPTGEPRAREHDLDAPRDPSWRRTSYTALTRGADDPHDRDEADEGEVPAVSEGEPVPLATFERGARAGTLLHAVLEHHDFGAGAAPLWDLADRELRRQGLDPAWGGVLTAGLTAALDTPIPTLGAALSTIPLSDTLRELDFDLPLAGGMAPGTPVPFARVVDVFRQHPTPGVPDGYTDRLARLGPEPLRGFLTGAIDLIVRRDGRYFVADWKSNHLGDRASDYGVAAMTRAMVEHHYVLQLHLYVVALHRLLRWRLPDYDYEAHVGGGLWLFLRGMVGGDAGVWAARPPREAVLALDRVLSGEGDPC
ncbi:MAG: hypothetical protein AMXMBFR64_03590 [Myxococcales bacterium]